MQHVGTHVISFILVVGRVHRLFPRFVSPFLAGVPIQNRIIVSTPQILDFHFSKIRAAAAQLRFPLGSRLEEMTWAWWFGTRETHLRWLCPAVPR